MNKWDPQKKHMESPNLVKLEKVSPNPLILQNWYIRVWEFSPHLMKLEHTPHSIKSFYSRLATWFTPPSLILTFNSQLISASLLPSISKKGRSDKALGFGSKKSSCHFCDSEFGPYFGRMSPWLNLCSFIMLYIEHCSLSIEHVSKMSQTVPHESSPSANPTLYFFL